MPPPEGDENHGGDNAEPLDAGVCALVGVAQLVLAELEVFHLAVDLADKLLDAAQLGLDGLELLGGLNGGPVLGVGADIDVELNVAERVRDVSRCMYMSARRLSKAAGFARGRQHTSRENVLEAHVKGGVLVRGEDRPLLASNISRPAILVADGILDLSS